MADEHLREAGYAKPIPEGAVAENTCYGETLATFEPGLPRFRLQFSLSSVHEPFKAGGGILLAMRALMRTTPMAPPITPPME